MEQEEKQEEITSFPVIARLDRLDSVLQLLEEKHSLSRKDLCAAASDNNECKSLSSALEEVQYKGTLLERLSLLEKRVLELSLENDRGNTSRYSSSIGMKDSESSIPKRKDENRVTITTQEMKDPSIIQAQESASSADGFMREIGQKKKSHKKWIWLLRLRC